MTSIKNLEYVTDPKGKKRKVLLGIAEFEKLQGEVEDLEDALALEKARKSATGFKRWKDFIAEIESAKKPR